MRLLNPEPRSFLTSHYHLERRRKWVWKWSLSSGRQWNHSRTQLTLWHCIVLPLSVDESVQCHDHPGTIPTTLSTWPHQHSTVPRRLSHAPRWNGSSTSGSSGIKGVIFSGREDLSSVSAINLLGVWGTQYLPVLWTRFSGLRQHQLGMASWG